MKRGIFALIVILCMIVSVHAATLDSSLQHAQGNKSIKVIVKLADTQAKGKLLASAQLNNKLSVAQTLSDNYNVTYVGKTTNYISMEVSQEQLSALTLRTDISSIALSPNLKVTLQQSRSIINDSLVAPLQIAGINITGLGQTVCVLDSGINYTHQDLGGCTTSQFLAGNCSKVIGGYAFYNAINSSNNNNVMDNNGHGTHVSGIVAASGTINGIATGAKIVMNKVCDSSGNCDGNAIADAINWCVGNSSLYNISVISISIGDGVGYNDASGCDNLYASLLKTPVANAIAKNISVVVATDNQGNTTGIAWPGCMTNVTAIGATNKDDTIASYSNRNNLVKLFAPGSNINSTGGPALGTCTTIGDYMSCSGTSMATPHVSAAIAMLKQVLSSLNMTKTPSQITAILNNTGKSITDSTNITYSRINLYSAILSLDIISPNVSLVSPTDGYSTINDSLSFSANFSDWVLANATFNFINSTGSNINSTSINITGQTNSTTVYLTNVSFGAYNWSFIAFDNNSNNFSITRTVHFNSPNITLISPADGYSETSNSANINFNFSINNSAIVQNCSLNSNNAPIINLTEINQSVAQNISKAFTPGSYSWHISCIDNQGNTTLSSARQFTITAPAATPAPTTTSSGGGGGGGATTKTYVPTIEQASSGYTKELKKQENVQFVLFDKQSEKHTLTVKAITKEYVNITIKSDPINLTLGIGQSAKLNLTSPDYYDLYVGLEDIVDGNAKITIQTINEPIKVVRVDQEVKDNFNIENTSVVNNNSSGGSVKRSNYGIYILIVIGIIAVSAFVMHLIDVRRKIRLKGVLFSRVHKNLH